MSVHDKKERLRRVECKACDRPVMLTRRPLDGGLARWMITLYRMCGESEFGWIHDSDAQKVVQGLIPEQKKLSATSYGSLKYWELTIPCPDKTEETKSASGMWRLSQKGIDFIHGRIEVPKAVLVYKNELRGFEDEPINIRDALSTPFDIRAIRRGEGVDYELC